MDEVDVPHRAIAGPPHLTTMFSPIQKSPSNGGRLPAFLIIGTLKCFVYHFNAYTEVFPLETVHLILLVLPQGIIVAGLHIIGRGAPGRWPGLYRLTLRKEVEKLTDGDHLNLASSFAIGQKGSVLPGQCLSLRNLFKGLRRWFYLLVNLGQECPLPTLDVMAISFGIHSRDHIDILALTLPLLQVSNEFLGSQVLKAYPVAEHVVTEENRYLLFITLRSVDNIEGPFRGARNTTQNNPAIT